MVLVGLCINLLLCLLDLDFVNKRFLLFLLLIISLTLIVFIILSILFTKLHCNEVCVEYCFNVYLLSTMNVYAS